MRKLAKTAIKPGRHEMTGVRIVEKEKSEVPKGLLWGTPLEAARYQAS